MTETIPGRFQLTLEGDVDLRLTSIKGIGPRTAAELAERGITDLKELLLLVPRKYRRIYRHHPGPEL
ncbi:MAG: hypothetical protein ACNA8W_11130, partial [Bradymonadaceae bacterium]